MKKRKNKSHKKESRSPKQQSVEDRGLQEPVIQDLIAGLKMTDIAEKHNLDRSTVGNVYAKYKERIDEKRAEFLKLREERIAQAFEDERDRTARLINKTGELMEKALDEAMKAFEEGRSDVVKTVEKETPEGTFTTTTKEPVVTLEDIRNLFKDVRSILIQYQKGSEDSAPAAEI